MKRLLFLVLATSVVTVMPAAFPAGEEKPGKAKSTPPGAPVEARLIANKNSYTLDRGGLSAEEYRKQVRNGATGGPGLPAPKVDLTLELVNTSDKEVEIRVGGTVNVIKLDLKGPGAEVIEFKGRLQPRFRINPKTVTLAPGKSVTVPISTLGFGLRGLTHAAYWTAPGSYTLTASYETTLKPAPAQAGEAGNGFGTVTLTSAPVKIQVQAR
jgi:hypothetical protein